MLIFFSTTITIPTLAWFLPALGIVLILWGWLVFKLIDRYMDWVMRRRWGPDWENPSKEAFNAEEPGGPASRTEHNHPGYP